MVEEASSLGEGPWEVDAPWVVACREELEASLGEVAARIQLVDPLAAESFQLLYLDLQVREEDPLELTLIFRLAKPFQLVIQLVPYPQRPFLVIDLVVLQHSL